MSDTSSSIHSKSDGQKPRRPPLPMKAVSRCRLADIVNRHQALQAYSSLVMTTDLYTPCLKKLRKIVFVRTSSNFHQF